MVGCREHGKSIYSKGLRGLFACGCGVQVAWEGLVWKNLQSGWPASAGLCAQGFFLVAGTGWGPRRQVRRSGQNRTALELDLEATLATS